MEYGVVKRLVDTRDRADVARNDRVDLGVRFAVELQQLADLEGFAGVADVQLVAAIDRALVHAERGQSALERVDVDHEHVADRMQRRVGPDLGRDGVFALALEELGRVGLHRVRHQAFEDLQ